ncbi:MAG: QueG-associated DUF1730 domain-containing protein [Nannocystaceae bacterium]
MSRLELDAPRLQRLAVQAERLGLLRLGAVSLDEPALAGARIALDRFLDSGRVGDMAFMERTRDLRKFPQRLLPGARTALVSAIPYRGEPGPIARYAQSQDYHTVAHRRLLAFERELQRELPGIEMLICVDTKPVPERALAALAGVGVLGKNGCLIVPGLGSYVVIGVLLCTASYDAHANRPVSCRTSSSSSSSSRSPSSPRERDASAAKPTPWQVCGSCTACLDACPTDAFVAPGELDARRCIAYLTIEHRGPVSPDLAEHLGQRVAGCDVCQEVCPHNHSEARNDRAPDHAWLPPPLGRDRTPDLLRLLSIGNNQYRGFVRHTALTRIPRRSMRRNAALALAHAQPRGLEVEHRLEELANDVDPVLRDAARWAFGFLKKRGSST